MLFDFDFAEDRLGFVLATPPAGATFDTEDDRLGIAGLSVEAAFSMAFIDDRLLFDLRLDCFLIAVFTSTFSLFETATMLDDFDAL